MLSGDVTRFKQLSQKKDLSIEDFGHRDQEMLLKMAASLLPLMEFKETDPNTGEVTVYEKPDFSKLPGQDEVSLVRFLKQHNKL